MAEASIEESVDNNTESASNSQHRENSSVGPLADEVKTENGIAHDIPVNENSAIVEVSVVTKNTPTESETLAESETKGKVDKQKEPSQMAPGSPTKRLVKPAHSTKPGTAPVTKPGSSAAPAKKVSSPGTFGSNKPATAKPPLSSSTSKPPQTSTIKKSPSMSSTTSAKPGTTTTAPSAKPAAITTTPSASRRTSMAPPASRPLSSSTSSRPLSSAGKAPPVASTTRVSVTSPAAVVEPLRSSSGPGVSRPRASVSEGVPAKKPGAPRPSLSTSKAPSTSGIRALRTSGPASISSIKEVKEDSKALQELEAKYNDAVSSLETNLERVKELEAQIEAATAALTAMEAERDQKQEALDALQASKASVESELKVVQDNLEGQRNDGEARLLQVKEELLAAQAASATQMNLVGTLQQQIKAVEAQVASAKEFMAETQSSHKKALAEAGNMEREALLKAKSDLEAIKAESDASIAAQRKAHAEAADRIKALEAEVENSLLLSAEVEQLKKEKEEVETKLSEMEIEVLEYRESVEKAADEQEKALARLRTIEQELAAAKQTNASAAEALRLKEQEYGVVLENLRVLESELVVARETHETLQADMKATEEAHAQMLAEIQRQHEGSSTAAAVEIQRIKADLEGQEARYASQLDGVKAEHANLLEQAFQKAKSEAGAEHSVELQNLRARSQATIEQMQQAHQTSLNDAQASHEEALETQVKGLEKQISTLKLELKATQDDLAKAKAGLEAALALEGTLRKHIEEKDAESATATVPVDQSEEVARLTKELGNAKDDLLNLTEAFSASKESFQQISSNHHVELEEAAKARAEEVTKLRETHDDAVTVFKRERDELVSRISELEVELTTLKAEAETQAAMAAMTPMSPRKETNGAVPGSSIVTKEELQRMHEAHNLKVYEIESSHVQIVKGLTEKLEAATQLATEQQSLAERLQMEVDFAEQSAEENEDQLQQLRDEIEHLQVQLQIAGAGP